MENDLLVVSALFGGPAEAVLRAIAHDNQDGIGEIADAELVLRSQPAWVQVDRNTLTMRSLLVHLEPVSGGENQIRTLFPLRLMLGIESGVVLRDVENVKLSRGRIFSTAHLVGSESKGIDYVMPVTPRILSHNLFHDPEKAFDQVHMNVRRAVHSICAFLIKHGRSGLLAERARIQAAETAREATCLDRKEGKDGYVGRRKSRKVDRREAIMADDRHDGLWEQAGWVG